MLRIAPLRSPRFTIRQTTRRALMRSTMLVATLASGMLSGTVQAQSLPGGGKVTAGSATIATSGSTTTITQSSGKSIIDWQSFSIGQGDTVQFNNGTGATLNRVTGTNLSSIDGLLSATGSVYLINPNGIVIGKSGVVKTGGGFVAATLDIDDANFLNGGDQTLAGTSLASVVNLGRIGALGGDVALVAANVRNDGTVIVPNGSLGLLAGSRVLMRDTTVNDGKFLVLSGGSATSVTNTGALEAASIELRAEGGNIYALAGNTAGIIRATGISATDGRIYLTAGDTGSVTVSDSTLKASESAGNGGTISITGGQIAVASDATLDASATTTTGNGGSVSVIADLTAGSLTFQGTALARSGATAGNGGQVETSGHTVNFDGAKIDTSAVGRSGTWLVDPDDLIVDSAAAATIDANLSTTDVTLQTTSSSASGPGTVDTSGNGDIIIDSALAWSSAHTLTLDAYHSIEINANVTVEGNGGVVLKTDDGGTLGDYTFALGASLSFDGTNPITSAANTSQSLNINGNAYTLLYSMSDLAGIDGQSGDYALASDQTASGPYYSSVVGSFSGTLTGLGHTINNLTISDSGDWDVGLVGANFGTLRDIGLIGGSVMGGGEVGALAGYNGGAISNVWSTVAVDGQSEYVGGLVGYNSGTIGNSFTNAVVGANNVYTDWTGGLAGTSYGTISNTYAMGPVTGSYYTGGLVGQNMNGALISDSYATGMVTNTGGGHIGGLVGGTLNPGSEVPYSYYDTTATGLGGYGISQTTSQLQGTLPAGFSSSTWATGASMYPYLLSFFPNGAHSISGTADTSGTTNLITAYSGGSAIGSTASVGVNGYYYILVPGEGSLTGTTPVGVSYSYDSNTTLSFTDAPTLAGGSITGLDLHGQYAEIATSQSLYSETQTELSNTFGSTTLSSLMSGLNLTTNGWINYDASGNYTIDTPVTLIRYTDFTTAGNLLSIDAPITVPADINVWFFSNKSIAFNADVTADHTSAVTIITNHSGPNGSDYTAGSSLGDYSFLPGASLTFTGTGGFLNINGNVYTLIDNLSQLTALNGQGGHYALNGSLDLSGSPFNASVINSFSGTFTGLGHTISNLDIDASSTNLVGLFGTNTGTVRDIGLVGGTVQGDFYSGSLIGENNGLVDDSYSSIDMQVTYRSGGLVGHNLGTVTNSRATGSVTSVGSNGGVSDMGGLVGWNQGTVSDSYATGTVTGSANTAGGLVGYNNGGTISNSFATGGVFGNEYAGGLVGYGDSNGTIVDSYATGYVHASLFGGGMAGNFIGTITDSYWDTTTSGTTIGIGNGSAVSGTGAVGLSRATLQDGTLPTGFSSSVWSTGNGLYPYLTALFPTGMQSISGYTYAANGTAAPATTLAVYIGGTQVGGTTAASGADGYYYLMATPGTVTGSTEIGITETPHNGTSVSGTAYTDTPILTSGQVTGFDVTAGQLTYATGEATYSALQSDAQATFGASLYSSLTTALTGAKLKIDASNAFTIDQAISRSGSALIQSGGDLSLASTGSVTSTASGTAVTLAADGAFINDAGTGAVSAANGRWLIYTQASGDATAAATGNSFGGLDGTDYYNDAFNFTTGALASTPNSGNRFVTGYAPSLTVTPGTAPVTYNGLAQTDTYTIAGYLPGDAANDTLTGSVGGLTTTSRNAGTYTLTATGTLVSNENYGISYSSGTFIIGKATLTLTAGTDTRTYNGTTTSDGTVGYTGLQTGDTLTGLTQSFGSKNVMGAGGSTLSVTGYSLSDGNSGNNYTVVTQTAAGTITPATLTLIAGSDSKTYDGTTASDGTVTYTNLQAGDSLTGLTQAFSSKNVLGTGGSTLSVIGYSLSDGNNGNNYTVVTQTASGTIAPATLTLIAGSDSKTYDGTTASDGTVTFTNLQAGDSLTGLTQAFGSKNVLGAGGSALSVTGYSLSDGNNGNNYTVVTQTASGTITPATLTLSAGTDTRTYNGTTTSDGTVGYTGLQTGDTLTGLTQAFSSKNVLGTGGSTLSVTGYSLSDGNNGGNYTVVTQTTAGTITPATLTLSAGTDTRTYNGTTTSDGTVGYTGLQTGDTLTGLTQSFGSKNVLGTGGSTLSVTGYSLSDGNNGNNYTVVTQTASGTIIPATLTLTAGNDSKTYDGTTASDGTVDYSGLQSGDSLSGLTQAFSSKNVMGTNGSTLSVTGYSLSDGNNGGNYTVVTQTASGTITPATLTLSAGGDSKTYDGTTASDGSVSVSGLQSGDSLSGLTQAFSSKNVMGTNGSTLSVTGYSLSDGNNGGNYTVVTQTASGTITPATLTASLTGATSKTYDSSVSATLTTGNYVLTGVLGSDSVALNDPASGTYANANAGTGKTVTVNGLTLSGADASDYIVNGTASANIGVITPQALTIAANPLGKNAGAADPLLTYVLTSGTLFGNDTLSGNLSRAVGENPGTYAITQGTLGASSNYDVTFTPGVFTITQVALQNNPVVNPVSSSSTGAGQPVIQPAPIGLNSPPTGSGPTASDASSSTSDSGNGQAKDAASSAGSGDEKATGPNVQAGGQANSLCTGSGCSNTPYPTNQVISSSISFSQ